MVKGDVEDSNYPRTGYEPIRFAKARAILRFEKNDLKFAANMGDANREDGINNSRSWY